MEINKKIKLIREDRKITQDYISYELGISQEAYSKLERGVSTISFNQVEIICNVFKIPLVDVLNSDIDILLKKNKKNMKEIKNYHATPRNKSVILDKWKPVLQKITNDEWKYSILANYAEKHSYYEEPLDTEENCNNLNNSEWVSKDIKVSSLPISIKTFGRINCKEGQIIFDEYDLKYILKEEIISSSLNVLNTMLNNTNYIDDITSELEHHISSSAITFIENYIKDNDKIVFQYPLFSNITLTQSSIDNRKKILTMSTKLYYYAN